MCRGMVDIQSATAEIRRGKRRKKKQDKNIMSTSATHGGHNKGGFDETVLTRKSCDILLNCTYLNVYVSMPN